MVVLNEARTESSRKILTASERTLRECSPPPEYLSSRRLDFGHRASRRFPLERRHNPIARSVTHSDDQRVPEIDQRVHETDQRVPEIDQRSSSPISDIIRNQEQTEDLSNGAVSFIKASSFSQSSDSRAREFMSQAPLSSPLQNGSDTSSCTLVDAQVVRRCSHREPDIPDYQYFPKTFLPWKLTFRQVFCVMRHFPYEANQDLIMRTILGHSLLIYGVPVNYPEEDLWVGVFLLFEQYFCMKPEFVYCARNLQGESDSSVVRVVFKKMTTRYEVWKMRHVLERTRYRMAPNVNIFWISDMVHRN